MDWFANMVQANSGSYSAQAGPIGDNGSTTLSFFGEFAAGGEISFWRKVSSEEGFDFLRFSINGEVLEEWSGEQDWEQVFFPARHGSNTFEWIFIKDSSSDSGEDTVWIDDILLPPAQ